MSVRKQILSNNIVLITEPVAGAKTAAIGFWFRVGSRFEPSDCRGVTHFVEHMLFKGTATRSAFDIAVAFDRIGGYVNAFTERENMCVHCVVPAEHTETALDVICDMTQNSVFDSEEIERERAVIKSEIISSLDDPEEAALDAASEAIWPGHAVSASIAGSVDDVEHLSRLSIVDWYSAHVAGGFLAVCVAGRVDVDMIVRTLEKLPKRKEAEHSSNLVAPVWKSDIVFTKAPFNQMQFFVQLPLKSPVAEDDYYSLAILNAIIGDTMSSRLFQSLREKGGFCYNVYSFLTFYSDAACWCAYSSSSKKDTIKVVKALLHELKRLAEHGFTDEEKVAACEHLCGEEIIACEEMEYRMKRLYRNHSFGFPQRSPEETVACIRNVKKEQLDTALNSLLDFSCMNLMVYGERPALSVQDRIKKHCTFV